MSMQVRRVVLAVDDAERTVRVVRAAVEVAASLGAELEGLFVEDDALLRLAEHTFARGHATSGGAEPFSARDLEQEWRALANEVRRALAREADLGSVKSSFAVSRGAVGAALNERLSRGDVVLVGWAGWAPSALRRPAPVRVLYDGRTAAERLLAVGARLAGEHGELSVWIAPDGERATALAAHVREQVGGRVGRLRIAGLRDATPATLRRAVAEEPGGLLLVSSDHAIAALLAQRSMAARFPCSVLIVH